MTDQYQFNATHHGSLHGIPCWIDMSDDIAPGVKAKFGFVGEIALDVMEFLFGIYCTTRSFFDPKFEPMYAIRVGKPVNKKPLN